MHKTMKISGRIIGEGHPVFVIAEAGINGGDSLDLSKQLVDLAVDSGADAVKFQTFKPSELKKQLKNITYDETIELKHYCDKKRILFLSTPHSLSAIDFLADLVPAYKIASPFITNSYFIKRVRVKGKPIIASTGSITHENHVATYGEIKSFLDLMTQDNGLALLYCVSEYPCYNFVEEEFSDFRFRYSGFIVGYSSHSKNINSALCAVQCGASIIEQHITLSDDYDCPDKKVSLNPEELKTLISEIRLFEKENML